ncbi:MAG: hypothetical protein IPO21_12100 [Bacteroidales bacterium]|nr:hypothetical protein [Bacteroidales bacterium]
MNLNKLFLTSTLLTAIFVTQSIGQISKVDYEDITGQDLSDKYNVITTAVPFLLIAPDSRAGAMGDVGVATSADVWSMRWNPSKYAFAEKDLSLGISYTPVA